MKCLTKFLLKEEIKILSLTSFAFFVFFSVIDFFERFSDFVSFHRSYLYFFEFLFWKGCVNFYQIFPYLLGLSAILVLFFLTRTKELFALLILGFSKRNLFVNITFHLLFLNLAAGILLNLISPYTFFKSVEVWEKKIVGKRKELILLKNRIIFEGKDYLLLATPLEPNAEFLGDLVFLRFEGEGVFGEVVWAKSAIYSGKHWLLEDAVIQNRATDYLPKALPRVAYNLPFKASTLVLVEKTVKFLTLRELYQRWKFLAKIGKPKQEVMAEIFLRFYYLFSGCLLGLWAVYVYLRYYNPTKEGEAVGYSFMSYLLLSLLFLLTLNSMGRFFLFSIILLASFLLLSIWSTLMGFKGNWRFKKSEVK